LINKVSDVLIFKPKKREQRGPSCLSIDYQEIYRSSPFIGKRGQLAETFGYQGMNPDFA